MDQSVEKRSRRSFPLSALFLLVTACAVIAGLIAIAVRGGGGGEKWFVGGIITEAVGLVLGAVIGFLMRLRVRWFFIGGGIGMLIGGGIGTVAMIKPEQVPEALLVCLVGSAVMLAVGAVTSRKKR